jgi:hypothetical protein
MILGWAVFAVTAVVQVSTRRFLPAPLREYLAAEHRAGLAEGFTPGVAAVGLLLAFSLFTQAGLFLLKRWARPCYVVAFAANYLFVFLAGRPTVTTASGYALASLNAALSGFLLSLLYFSPCKGLFENPQGLT